MKILILGMDGYLGWPLSQKLLSQGNEICGVDNFSRREHVIEMGSTSALPILPMKQRMEKLKGIYGSKASFYEGDVLNPEFVNQVLKNFSPDAIVDLAEQPSAPYSMIDQDHCLYTHQNNVMGTLNLIYGIKNYAPKAHLVKLGTMGEYGYDPGLDIPEGFFDIEYRGKKANIPYPKMAGSWYHWTKAHDSNNIMFACKIWGLKSTDIMQGIVYGTRLKDMPPETYQNTRFDFDEAFGTVINRYCAQAVLGHKLTIYGKGLQTRGFLALEDSIQCISLLLDNPPMDQNYRVVNQFDEQYNITELAKKVKRIGDKKGLNVETGSINNPRVEKEVHYYKADHNKLRELGFRAKRHIDEEISIMLDDLIPNRETIKQYEHAIVKDIKWAKETKTMEKKLSQKI
jgi:UDP-sulfoquinovose synthase